MENFKDGTNSDLENFRDKYQGAIIDLSNYDSSGEIGKYLGHNRSFSIALNAKKFRKNIKEMFFFTLDGKTISWCSLGLKGKQVVTGKHKIVFDDFVQLENPILITQLKGKLRKTIKQHFTNATSGNGGKLPKKTWAAFIDVITANNNESINEILALFNKRYGKFINPDTRGILSQQKDAFSFAIYANDIDIKHPDTNLVITYPNGRKNDAIPPFLKGLQPQVLSEDLIIHHDSSIFSDWEKQEQLTPDIITQYTNGSKMVTIKNFNRHKVEELLGVDLLYYDHYHHSYILVQYKKLDSETKVYRPFSDNTYNKEHKNLTRISTLISKRNDENVISNVSHFRLDNNFCFFKVCESRPINVNSNNLIKGMYFPLQLWDILLESDSTTGPLMGKKIGFKESQNRYLNNTEFISLLKGGWIGSQGIGTDTITEIIKEIIDNKRSLILVESSR